jgi:hypothetical protein
MKKTKKPLKTERDWALIRARMCCDIGLDTLDGVNEAPSRTTSIEYAFYNLLHAVKNLVIAMQEDTKGKVKP